jgi:hypothetical protein
MINHVFEDFAKRKNIDAKNCFLPNKKLTFFVNCNQKSTWHLVEIFWKLITGHPSYFVVNLKSSKFNSFKESYGNNFHLLHTRNSYWDEIEVDLKYFLVNDFYLNYNYLINQNYQAKIVSWLLFCNSIGEVHESIDKDLKNVLNNNSFNNFFKFKDYEYEVDQKLLFLKKTHKIFYNYYEIYFEQELLDNYWYNSYHFLSDFYFDSKLKAQVYTT